MRRWPGCWRPPTAGTDPTSAARSAAGGRRGTWRRPPAEPDAQDLLVAAEDRALELELSAMVDRIRRSLRAIGVVRRSAAGSGTAGLTAREEQVLDLVGVGARSTDIAAALGVEVSTVESFVRSAMQKLGASTRVAAAATLQELRGDQPWKAGFTPPPGRPLQRLTAAAVVSTPKRLADLGEEPVGRAARDVELLGGRRHRGAAPRGRRAAARGPVAARGRRSAAAPRTAPGHATLCRSSRNRCRAEPSTVTATASPAPRASAVMAAPTAASLSMSPTHARRRRARSHGSAGSSNPA